MPKHWNTVNLEYPVRQFPETGITSQQLGHNWRNQPEILKSIKPKQDPKELEYRYNYNINEDLNRSQTKIDYGCKSSNTERINKHNSSVSNEYLYPSTRKLERHPLKLSSFSTTENQDNFTLPKFPSRLVTEKNQYKHPITVQNCKDIEPIWQKDYPELDTTYEGFEKYLDPYLTTNRLYHRPYTAEQLHKPAASKDIVTYYTLAEIPWIHTPKPNCGYWWLKQGRPIKSTYDREKFKQHFREILVHNQPNWVPGTFRTESRDNYKDSTSSIGKRSLDIEDNVKGYYQKSMSNLPAKIKEEDRELYKNYSTETNHIGSGKALCAVFNQFVKKNQRLINIQNK